MDLLIPRTASITMLLTMCILPLLPAVGLPLLAVCCHPIFRRLWRDSRHRLRLRGGLGSGLKHVPPVLQSGKQRIAQVLGEMKAFRDLGGLRCAPSGCFCIGRRAIPAHDLDRWVVSQPGRDRRGIPVRKNIQDAMGIEVNDQRPIVVPPPPGPFIDANGTGHSRLRGRCGADEPQQGGWTGRQVLLTTAPRASVPTQRQRNGGQFVLCAAGAARIRSGDSRQSLGKELLWAGCRATAKAADGQVIAHRTGDPGQIR
jgi:hypothetical protein